MGVLYVLFYNGIDLKLHSLEKRKITELMCSVSALIWLDNDVPLAKAVSFLILNSNNKRKG